MTQQEHKSLPPARDDDQFVLSAHAAYYVAFLDAGHCSDDAQKLADMAAVNPNKPLEDIKLGKTRPMILGA